MNISIMSRLEIIDFASCNHDGSYAVISITDVGSPTPVLTRKGNGVDSVCALKFDDVEEGGENCVTNEDAKKIVSFVNSLDKTTAQLIVHCEFGQCRSAGVAAAVSLAINGDDSWVFQDRRYYPNMTCYQKVLKAFERQRKPE